MDNAVTTHEGVKKEKTTIHKDLVEKYSMIAGTPE